MKALYDYAAPVGPPSQTAAKALYGPQPAAAPGPAGSCRR